MKNYFKLPIIIIIIIIVVRIYKDFNFKTFTFKEPWIDTLYIVTFTILIFLLFWKKKN
jgi:hypothetical protein